MAMIPFLAMTPAEIQNSLALPSKIAWMSCHFSPGGRGISNIPSSLPAGSLLILDDLTPFCGHDPEEITRQVMPCIQEASPFGILLDFQRPENRDTAELASYLSEVLPCPVITSEVYAGKGPVFLPPVPLSIPLQEHLSPWSGREIWLDLGCWGEILTLTGEGCKSAPLSPWELPEDGFPEERLHCHYRITVSEASAEFILWRTADDLSALLEEAESLGVVGSVGLFQELYPFFA